jgi:poly-gamma-glutamate capsule biosynthesis protein CapA/YwtB (metallophosphatase superfamily)
MLARKNTWLFIFLGFVFLNIVLLFLYQNYKNESFPQILPRVSEKVSQTLPKAEPISIILGGDVMLGRTVETKARSEEDFSYPFRKIYQELAEADLVFVNLENPIIDNCPLTDSGFKFCANTQLLEGLSLAGVDIVSLANNHSGNYGQDGVSQTVKFLSQNNVVATGLGELVIKKIGEVKFGFLGFNLIYRYMTDNELKLVVDSDSKVDVLIIAVHWGDEYTKNPTELQQDIAGKLVESGADVVVGSHPHWVEGMECIDTNSTTSSEYIQGIEYKTPRRWVSYDTLENTNKNDPCGENQKLILYSLGNLIFDQMWSEETKRGELVELIYNGAKLQEVTIIKTYMSAWAQPEIVE